MAETGVLRYLLADIFVHHLDLNEYLGILI
jgi:hypothetical protein